MTNSEEKSSVVNYISAETEVKGDIVSDNDLVVDGTIYGNIISKKSVHIKSKGFVKGNISCCYFYCEGQVEGNVVVDKSSELNNKASIKGSMQCQTLLTKFDCLIEKGLRLKK